MSLHKEGCALDPQGNLAKTVHTGPQIPGCALTVTSTMDKGRGHDGRGSNDTEDDSYLRKLCGLVASAQDSMKGDRAGLISSWTRNTLRETVL